MIANPTEKEFAGMVRERLLTNCPVTVRNVDNANRIFGPDLANLRGKTTRTKPEHVRVESSEVVLCPILYCIDVFSTYLGKILDFVVVHWSFIFVSHVSWLIVEFI